MIIEYVPLTTSYHLYFLRISKVWRMLHHGSVGEFRVINATSYLYIHFFVLFHQKLSAFIIFISFFDEVSHFCNRILTKQKLELVTRNYLWNCMTESK